MLFAPFRLLGAAVLGLAACQSHPDKPPATASPAPHRPPLPEPRLVTHALGRSGYSVALPADYSLKSTDAADFQVYYFASADTLSRHYFTGGLYFGTQPQGPDSTTADCQVRRQPATLLGRPATWHVTRCASGYTVHALFDSHSGRGWDAQINAFGEARSAAELRQLLAVFATLRREVKP